MKKAVRSQVYLFWSYYETHSVSKQGVEDMFGLDICELVKALAI